MASAPKRIRVISDGRPGHENQSMGLAAAIARRAGSAVETVQLPAGGWLAVRCRAAMSIASGPPDLLIGTGHKVHLPVWFAARKFPAKSVVIMKPTWSVRLFDLCFIPQHDLKSADLAAHIIPTRGALNRVPEEVPPKQPRGVVMIGGPSRNHGWAGAPLTEAVESVIRSRPDLGWTVGDSRRTPAGFLEQLAGRGWPAEFVSHSQTKPGWLPSQLLAAEEVWVTEDSVSMIFESVTAGARTGLLPIPLVRSNAGVQRAVQELVKEKYAMPYAAWLQTGQRLPAPTRLHETARCAEIVLARLFAAH